MKFVKIIGNKKIFEDNISRISYALHIGRIKHGQSELLTANNWKGFKICKHKGLMEIRDQKILFCPRTSNEKSIRLPRDLDDLKNIKSNQNVDLRIVEFFRVSEKCNIGNFKGILGTEDDGKILTQDFEERKDVVARLVGTDTDLANGKALVSNGHFELHDISPYFNMDQVIDELSIFNIDNLIRDE